MKTVKVTKLNKAENALKGMKIPVQKNGNVGVLVEDTLEDLNYQMSRNSGIDIPGLNVEVKSKGLESKSSYSFGSLTYESIKDLDYDSSPIKEKCQTIFIVEHSQTFLTVSDARVLDFSKDCIQEKLRDAYNSARDKMIAGEFANYIKGHDESWGYFERKTKNRKPTNNWAFRIPVDKMKKLQGMARSNFDNLLN